MAGEKKTKPSSASKVSQKQGKKSKKSKIRKRILLVILAILIVVAGIFAVKLGATLLQMKKGAVELISTVSRDTFKSSQTTLVYDTNGNVITKLKGEKDVYYQEYSEISEDWIKAVVAVEDERFYKHHGIDPKGIARAVWSLIRNRGEIHEGASTITQQLVKLTFLSNEQTYDRKLKEMFIAMELEKVYNKQDILEFYLNNVYYGNGYYGIQAASQGYFNKDSSELNLSEIAFLTAIPNRPTYYDPYQHPENTMKRRSKILKNMLETKAITQDEYNKIIKQEVKLAKRKKLEKHDYVETYVINCATKAIMKQSGFKFQYTFKNDKERDAYQDIYEKQYAACKKSLFSEGYRIYTTIDLDLQKKLQDSVNKKLASYTSKGGGIYKVQGAGTCIDNSNGKVVAIVGGRSQDNLEGYTLNRAFQSARQPGSSLKPLVVYAPVLERGYTPSSTVNDGPMSNSDPHKVRNSGGSYRGSISLRAAVMKSSNVATMRLYEQLGPKTALSYLTKMHFTHLVDRDYTYYTTCLGGMTYGVTTEEMAGGYAALANDGVYRQPTCIESITDSNGNLVVAGSGSKSKRVYSKNSAAMMTDVLQSVVKGGTGVGNKINNFKTAGKTGTTTNYKDGWFCGYTSKYTTAIWVGRDDNKVMNGLHGSSYPAYIWKDFMSEIHKGLKGDDNVKSKVTYSKGGKSMPMTTTAATASTQVASTTENANKDATTTEAKTTTAAPTTAAPTTATPTTAAPTTAAPTTAAPTTAAPTTAAPEPDHGGEGEE